MRLALLVGAGSFIGGICRYLLSTFIHSKSGAPFPYGTLVVNLTGCLAIGILYGIIEKLSIDSRLFLITGILGGFTTFSAFSGETFLLIKEGRFIASVMYVLISVAGGVALTAFGAWIFKLSLR
ncbi:MAG: fluoride efflux transporter CrcB [Chitinophagaceae bacterium]|nr:fluoride efflux transporter CrcB [Chitinophagaceae bacterium]